MRFAAAALFFAGAVMAGTEVAESTVYSTEYLTITSCAPEVTDCPARTTTKVHPMTTSTVLSTTVHTITSCAPEVTNCPARTHTKVYPVTTSTVYSTTVHTITSCAPTVTNCPAHSTVLSTEIVAAYTTVCPVTAGNGGKSYYNSTIGAAPSKTWTPYGGGKGSGSGPSAGSPAPTGSSIPAACPTYSVKTISTSVTTVVPTVIYETVAIPCPTAPGAGSVGTGTGSYTKPTTVVTAGAANVAVSGALAAAAGLIAVFLA